LYTGGERKEVESRTPERKKENATAQREKLSNELWQRNAGKCVAKKEGQPGMAVPAEKKDREA
jgi:hypothetical protein